MRLLCVLFSHLVKGLVLRVAGFTDDDPHAQIESEAHEGGGKITHIGEIKFPEGHRVGAFQRLVEATPREGVPPNRSLYAVFCWAQ
jgi:hypothetical protein